MAEFGDDVHAFITDAERILPGKAAPKGAVDDRWQALIRVGDFVQSDPETIWPFVLKWGSHEDEDLRAAVGTILLEHLLEYHFDAIFPRVEAACHANPYFADTLKRCWKLGQANEAERGKLFDALRDSL